MCQNLHLVILTSDQDCDGVSYGAHRISVPATRAIPLWTDSEAAMAYAKASGQLSGYYDGADKVMTAAEFRAEFFPNMSQWDRDYFTETGYTSGHMAPAWNPWVYDDTIGIPALDSRYDD